MLVPSYFWKQPYNPIIIGDFIIELHARKNQALVTFNFPVGALYESRGEFGRLGFRS